MNWVLFNVLRYRNFFFHLNILIPRNSKSVSSFLRETKEARKKKATLKKKKTNLRLHRRGANGASRRSRSSAAGLAHDACIISSVLKMRPSASFPYLRIRDTKRSSYDEDDEAEAESDLDDFIVHSSEEERQADAARQQRRSEKLQRKQKQKQKKSKRDAEPAAEVKARKDGFVPALKKSKPSRRIVVDSDEESDGDVKEGDKITKGDDAREDDDDGEDSEENSDESDEEEEDENLLYLKVPIQLDDHAVVFRVCEVIAVS